MKEKCVLALWLGTVPYTYNTNEFCPVLVLINYI